MLFQNIFKNRSALDFETPPFDKYPFHQLQNYLSRQYKDKVTFFKEKIYSHSQSKFFDGIDFNYEMFVNFMNCIMTLFNNQELLNYQEILHMVMDQECEINLNRARERYKEILAGYFAKRTEAVNNTELF